MSGPHDEMNDDAWLALLRGQAADYDQLEERQVRALRETIASWYEGEVRAAESASQQELERLLFRLRAEGLLDAPRRKSWLQPRWMAMAASVAVLAIGLSMTGKFWNVANEQHNDGAVLRGEGNAQIIRTVDLELALQRIQQEYDRLGIGYKVSRNPHSIVVDAYIPSEAEEPLLNLFREWGVRPAANGQLLIEIRR